MLIFSRSNMFRTTSASHGTKKKGKAPSQQPRQSAPDLISLQYATTKARAGAQMKRNKLCLPSIGRRRQKMILLLLVVVLKGLRMCLLKLGIDST